ncbi:Probable protein phosphatase 2C 58 [Linum perenne]
MTGGREILHKMKVKAGLCATGSEPVKGKGKVYDHITYGSHMVKGKSHHAMEDYVVSDLKHVNNHELGLFAIFDGHLGHDVANYLQNHLFGNILKESDFWSDTESAIKNAYIKTDAEILEKALTLGKGGSTAVTAILINGEKLVVANVGDSRAVICKNGDVPRVDGQLAVARAFGDRSLKVHLSSEPDVSEESVDDEAEFLILASDGVWKVMSNQEAVDSIKTVKDAKTAAHQLIEEALARKSKDDISCIVVRFQ